ncbi:hypothetical protein NVP1083O_13 [Vibrio phage 1.083.O._10N.286.52.B9]|nr:hypothetical protein NVP1083O_13 [Vibrio phage 1.083.O._10N.286.52.B9]AUS02247.1 hypothetical protein NVP2096O_12 [Vibrio phage 2.096.O._10N.286.48.B5]
MRDHKQVRQYSDQMHCSFCNRQWDVNDIDPPECMSGHDKFLEMRERLRDENNE